MSCVVDVIKTYALNNKLSNMMDTNDKKAMFLAICYSHIFPKNCFISSSTLGLTYAKIVILYLNKTLSETNYLINGEFYNYPHLNCSNIFYSNL